MKCGGVTIGAISALDDGSPCSLKYYHLKGFSESMPLIR